MSVEGWQEISLGNILFSRNDKSKQIKSSEYLKNGSYPIIDQSSDFICGYCDDIKKVISNGLPYIVFGDHTRHTKFIDFPFVVGADGTQIIKSTKEVDDLFFFYLVLYAAERIGNYGYDRHFKHLKQFICDYPIDQSEQTQIATILSTIDRAIEQTEALIAKQQRIKTGLMQDLLTKGIDENGNIRSEETHKFKDSPLGRIPVEWEVKPLASVAEIIMGQSPQGYTYNQIGEGTPLINGPTEFGTRYIERVNQWTTSPTKLCKRGDVLFCVRGSTTGRINIANDVYCIGRGLAAIREVKNKSINSFLELFLTQLVEQLFSEASGSGSTFPSITSNRLSATLILVPSIEEQNQIVLIINSYDRHICTEETHLNKLHSLKTGLMQDLLTGKVRVTDLLNQKTAAN
ncbi:restriction endonuclease subunit S [Microcystis aeruginosa]|uniref:restriction endonuclease subunit S n=1 Tax=Microcystis aeruginosa TaxID=1126 RepID=UPI00287FB4AE|nr:restriction endonuclease subunit S [Microcystis aeruginosa]WNF16722.1 restriction endonuclease subunit S [Microcystis aeruginosa NRERC-214]